jgi:hypothetical protein
VQICSWDIEVDKAKLFKNSTSNSSSQEQIMIEFSKQIYSKNEITSKEFAMHFFSQDAETFAKATMNVIIFEKTFLINELSTKTFVLMIICSRSWSLNVIECNVASS